MHEACIRVTEWQGEDIGMASTPHAGLQIACGKQQTLDVINFSIWACSQHVTPDIRLMGHGGCPCLWELPLPS